MMAAVGLKPAEEVKLFEDKWFVIFVEAVRGRHETSSRIERVCWRQARCR